MQSASQYATADSTMLYCVSIGGHNKPINHQWHSWQLRQVDHLPSYDDEQQHVWHASYAHNNILIISWYDFAQLTKLLRGTQQNAQT